MKVKIVREENLPKFIKKLQTRYQVFAPIKKCGEYNFEQLSSGEFHMPPLKSPVTVLPLKKIFWPDDEILWENSNSNSQNKKTTSQRPIAVIGVHKTDLEAIFILDRILKNDPEYWRRRKQSLLLLSENEEGGKYRFTFYNFEPRNYKFTPDELIHNPNLPQIIKNSKNHPVWEKTAEKCLGCGVCAYVCPLCYCFEVEDKIELEDGSCARCREWDTCFSPQFMEMAGKVNPQAELKDRLYNWYHHKFVRMPAEAGQVGCTNCGRCIKYCPAGINFREVLEELVK